MCGLLQERSVPGTVDGPPTRRRPSPSTAVGPRCRRSPSTSNGASLPAVRSSRSVSPSITSTETVTGGSPACSRAACSCSASSVSRFRTYSPGLWPAGQLSGTPHVAAACQTWMASTPVPRRAASDAATLIACSELGESSTPTTTSGELAITQQSHSMRRCDRCDRSYVPFDVARRRVDQLTERRR
jgi:hypothetical protein